MLGTIFVFALPSSFRSFVFGTGLRIPGLLRLPRFNARLLCGPAYLE